MHETKGKTVKITASKGKNTFEAQSIDFVESENYYIKLCTPFYQFIYEQIEIMRRDANEVTT